MTATVPSTIPRRTQQAPAWLRKIFGTQEGVLALSLIGLMVIVGVLNPRFLSPANLSNVFQGNAYIAVAAIGMSMVIISGNIDISVGPLISALAILCGTVATSGFPVWVAWLVPLVAGGLMGAFIGVIVAYLRIPSIVVTLGMYSIIKGGIVLLAESKTIYDLPEGFGLAQLSPLGIPMPVYFMVVLTILAAIWMRYSPTSRAIYAVGGNAEAARLSGIRVRRTIVTTFIINGVMVGIASVLLATQFNQIQATPPPGLELFIISSAVVGGVSILGGTGTVIGATLAAVLLSAISKAMIFINVSPYWLQAVQGILILITVLADILRRRRQLRALRE
jgi:ribose/xylose/arabinose/galactoside ABC-type transport system permease subunit